MTITPEDITFAEEVIAFNPDAFLGGSYLIKGIEAGDIDVVVPFASWERTRIHFGDRITKVLKDVPTEGEVPDEDERLVCVYRRGAVDLIVIADAFVEAYRKANRDIAADPERFADRTARVAIHVYYADEVRVSTGRMTEAEIRAKRGNRPAMYDADKKPSEAQP